jgi:5-methylcytosine-specific restriction endonuclease McrA
MPNGQWAGSTRRARLPSNWYTELVPETFAVFGGICHVCGEPGADQVDHVIAGDDHSLANRRPIHGPNTPQRCHVYKSSAEGGRAAQARKPKRQRPPEPHPGLRKSR